MKIKIQKVTNATCYIGFTRKGTLALKGWQAWSKRKYKHSTQCSPSVGGAHTEAASGWDPPL